MHPVANNHPQVPLCKRGLEAHAFGCFSYAQGVTQVHWDSVHRSQLGDPSMKVSRFFFFSLHELPLLFLSFSLRNQNSWKRQKSEECVSLNTFLASHLKPSLRRSHTMWWQDSVISPVDWESPSQLFSRDPLGFWGLGNSTSSDHITLGVRQAIALRYIALKVFFCSWTIGCFWLPDMTEPTLQNKGKKVTWCHSLLTGHPEERDRRPLDLYLTSHAALWSKSPSSRVHPIMVWGWNLVGWWI